MSKDKDWKKYLLASGLPLEQAAATVIRRAGYLVTFEYPYLRYNEQQLPGSFSIDLRGIKRLEEEGYSAVILAECKYRAINTTWVFSLDDDEAPFNNPRSILGTHNMYSTRYLPGKLRSDVFNQSDYSFRGVEIKSNSGDNPISITQDVNQLGYAFLESAIEHAKINLNDLFVLAGWPRLPSAVVNIIITTAELKILNSGLDIDDFHKAQTIEEVSTTRKHVILSSPPEPYYQFYAQKRIKETLSLSNLGEDKFLVNIDKITETSAQTHLDDFILSNARLQPSIFCIVNFDYLAEFLDLISDEMSNIPVLSPENARRVHNIK